MGIHLWSGDSPKMTSNAESVSKTSSCQNVYCTCILTSSHDDVIKWKHFSRYWPFVWGIHRSPVNSPHKGQWRGALMFSLICVWINDWENNREAGDLRRYRTHYDVIVMARVLIKFMQRNGLLHATIYPRGYLSPKGQISESPKHLFLSIRQPAIWWLSSKIAEISERRQHWQISKWEWTTGVLVEEASQWLTDWSSEWVSEWVSKWVNEGGSEGVRERASDWLSEPSWHWFFFSPLKQWNRQTALLLALLCGKPFERDFYSRNDR